MKARWDTSRPSLLRKVKVWVITVVGAASIAACDSRATAEGTNSGSDELLRLASAAELPLRGRTAQSRSDASSQLFVAAPDERATAQLSELSAPGPSGCQRFDRSFAAMQTASSETRAARRVLAAQARGQMASICDPTWPMRTWSTHRR